MFDNIKQPVSQRKNILMACLLAALCAGSALAAPVMPTVIQDHQVPLAGLTVSAAAAGTSVPLSASGGAAVSVRENQASGKVVYQKGGSAIDASNISQGYVMVKQSGETARLKVQIIKDGKTYNYDLNNAGNYEAFPFQSGSGAYKVKIMRNLSGNKYGMLYSADLNVKLESDFIPFLYPSQYCNYTSTSKAAAQGAALCAGLTSDLDKVKAVYNWITSNITYDKDTALMVQSGYLPNVDNTLAKKQGICFDYASLMACMLRSQNIPTKIVVGTVAPDNINHAWNEVYIKDVGWISVGIAANGSSWERMDSTFGASKSKDIEKFIGTGSNYTALRIY